MQVWAYHKLHEDGVLPHHLLGYGFASPTAFEGRAVPKPSAYPLYHVLNGDDLVPRMGAQIRVEGRTAIVEGVERLTPANIQAYDLRAGAAMLIAALAADGVSEITNVQYIERGYEDIIGKLRALGAKIDCVEENDEPPIRQIG